MTEDLKNGQTTEEIVREVLGITYDEFGFQKDAKMIANIVELLEDDSKNSADTEDEASEAAAEVRETLWNRYSGGGVSASATCELFLVLGRTNELGWLKDEANGFKSWQQGMFLKNLAEIRTMKRRMFDDIPE